MREVMRDKGVLKDYLKTHHYDPASKYYNQFAVVSEPLANYIDVSICLAAKIGGGGAERREGGCPWEGVEGHSPMSKGAGMGKEQEEHLPDPTWPLAAALERSELCHAADISCVLSCPILWGAVGSGGLGIRRTSLFL